MSRTWRRWWTRRPIRSSATRRRTPTHRKEDKYYLMLCYLFESCCLYYFLRIPLFFKNQPRTAQPFFHYTSASVIDWFFCCVISRHSFPPFPSKSEWENGVELLWKSLQKRNTEFHHPRICRTSTITHFRLVRFHREINVATNGTVPSTIGSPNLTTSYFSQKKSLAQKSLYLLIN